MQTQMTGGHVPCSPPQAANSQMPLGPRPGMPIGPGMGGPAPPMGGPVMYSSGYNAPMPGVPAGYSGQMSAGNNQMMMGSGPAAGAGGGGMAPMDSQMGVSQNMGSHQGIGGPNIPNSQPPAGPGMPGPMGASGSFMPGGGPSMAGQMQQPNGFPLMTPSVSGPMTSMGGGAVSGMNTGSSVPVGSPTGSQVSVSSSTSQSTVVSTVSNQVPLGGPFTSSGSSMASQVVPSSSTGIQVPASGSSTPNQMGTYPGMPPPQQQMQIPGSGVMMQPAPNDMNGCQGMPSSSVSISNGPGVGQGVVGPVGQMTCTPAQGSSGPLPGPGGMNIASPPMMGGPVSQMQNNMVSGGTLSSGSVAGQPGTGSMPSSRPPNQFIGGPTSSGQMGSGLPSSVAAASQIAGQHMGGTTARMPNPSSVGPSPGQPQMSGTQQPVPYGYGGSVGPGQPLHQSSAVNNMYGWNAPSSGGGMPPNMMSQGMNISYHLTLLLLLLLIFD